MLRVALSGRGRGRGLMHSGLSSSLVSPHGCHASFGMYHVKYAEKPALSHVPYIKKHIDY